ncbi:MAG: hypothetical protein DWQ10_17060, partial [Calditrichaeota bacterium]
MDDKFEHELSLKDLIRIFYRGRWVIISSFAAVMFLTTYYTFTVTPEYEASAKVIVQEESARGMDIFDIGGFIQQETMINNQVEILKSRTLAETVIHNLQKSELASQLEILRTGKYAEDPKSMIAGFKSTIKSVLGMTASEADYSFDDKVGDLMEHRLSITPLRNTDMIEIKVTAVTPDEAAFIANNLTVAYQEKNRSMSQEEVRQVKEFLEDQLGSIKTQLAESENALRDFMQNKKVVALSHETEELIKKLAEFEGFYHEALTSLNSFRERLAYINEQLGKNRQNFDIESISADTYFEELKKSMAILQSRRSAYMANLINRGVYNENDMELKKFDEQIAGLTEKLKTELAKLASQDIVNPVAMNEQLFKSKVEVEANIQALKPKVTSLKSIVDEYTGKLESLPQKSLQLARLQRAAKVDEKIYLMMKEKFQESRITEVGQLGDVRIIDPAKPPKNPVRPKKMLNMILGVIVGLGLGVGITFLLEAMDNSIRTSEDVERIGVTILGSIPVIKEQETYNKIKVQSKNMQNGTPDDVKRMASRLITHFAPKSPISEAYRTFRTNIQYAKIDRRLQTMLVTSPGPGEGKSTSAVNLAITMAQMGSRVVLIDADLRRPVVHSIFNTDRRIGLTNLLIGRAKLEETIVQTEINNLSIITCGTLPPNPSELLGSEPMDRLLVELKAKFDVVLFDTPPVIAVTDAAVWAAKWMALCRWLNPARPIKKPASV